MWVLWLLKTALRVNPTWSVNRMHDVEINGLQSFHFLTWYGCRSCSFIINIFCTTNCKTPTLVASRWVLMSGSSSTHSKICSSAWSIFRSYHGYDRKFEGWRYHDLGDAAPLIHKALPCRHALNRKNLPFRKTLTEQTAATNWYMTGPYRAFGRCLSVHHFFGS